jgi:hypothetical protein
MGWKKERDLLIAQTLAFVESVTGKTPDLEPASLEPASLEPRPSLEPRTSLEKSLEPPELAQKSFEQSSAATSSDGEGAPGPVARAVQLAPSAAIKIDGKSVEPPKDAAKTIKDIQLSIHVPRSTVSSDVRTEMQTRLANFRAHQERFHRQREEYCSATLREARTATGNHSAPALLTARHADPGPRSSQAPATGVSKTPAGSRSSESGQGPS